MPRLGVVTEGEVVAWPAPDPPGRALLDEPLHATTRSVPTPSATATSQKRLQARNLRVDSIVMEAAQFYRDAAPAPERQSRADLEARVAELERVVATLMSLESERRAERRTDQLDPVALTRALHPRGRRGTRNAKRGSSADGTITMRAVLFQPPSSRSKRVGSPAATRSSAKGYARPALGPQPSRPS